MIPKINPKGLNVFGRECALWTPSKPGTRFLLKIAYWEKRRSEEGEVFSEGIYTLHYFIALVDCNETREYL